MSEDPMIIVHAMVKPGALEEARKVLEATAPGGLTASRDGRRLRFKLSRSKLEETLGVSLERRRHQVRLGPVTRRVGHHVWPDDHELPKDIGEHVDGFLIPQPADYH